MKQVVLSEVQYSSDESISNIYTLYNNAFPREERRPWDQEMTLLDSGIPFFKLWEARIDDRFAGFATVWQLPGAVYIEHLAVADSMRGIGIGGGILDDIVRKAGDQPVVVEVELPATGEDAARRVTFYERHGFSALEDFEYFQPPYSPGLPDVQLMLMTTRQLLDIKSFVIMLHALVYNQ